MGVMEFFTAFNTSGMMSEYFSVCNKTKVNWRSGVGILGKHIIIGHGLIVVTFSLDSNKNK